MSDEQLSAMECEEELIIDVFRTKRVEFVHADRRGREGDIGEKNYSSQRSLLSSLSPVSFLAKE
jgi:hypothetical protein